MRQGWPMSCNDRNESTRSCVFCRSTSNLTREHVLPDWLKDIGLDGAPSMHQSGPLNRVPRQWSSTPFNTKVRMVCTTCNSDWLSELENAARSEEHTSELQLL